MKKRIYVILLTIILAIHTLGSNVILSKAQPAESDNMEFGTGAFEIESEEIQSIFQDEDMKPDFAMPLLRASAASTSGYPEKFDMRDCEWVTDQIRSQGSTDTCWAFSLIGAMELRAKYEEQISSTEKLSPYHFADFFYNHVTNNIGLTAKDRNHVTSGKTPLSNGGNVQYALLAAANWVGAANENIAPFTDVYTMLDSNLAYQNEVVLENGYFLTTDRTIAEGESESPLDKEIKRALMSCMPVAFQYKTTSNGGTTYYDSNNFSYYVDDKNAKLLGHSCVIIGWDDNYSKENFKKIPSRDGAWIVKNSWGATWGEDGYFYLSYDNVDLTSCVAVDTMEADKYHNNYQYDGSSGVSYLGVEDNTKISFANVFEVKQGSDIQEYLEAVQIAVKSVNTDYEIQIYTGLTDQNNPESGYLGLKQPITGTTSWSGIYTIPLNEAIPLVDGELVAVVVKLQKNDGAIIFVEKTQSWENGWISFDADIQSGQSFYKTETSSMWTDLATRDSACLARIKMFTNDINKEHIGDTERYNVSISQNSLEYDGNKKEPKISVSNNSLGVELQEGEDFTVAYEDNELPGQGKAIVTGQGNYCGTVTKEFTITPRASEGCEHNYVAGTCIYCHYQLQSPNISDDSEYNFSYYLDRERQTFTLNITQEGDGTLIYESKNPEVVSVDKYGVMTLHRVGTTQILVKAIDSPTKKYMDEQKTIKVTVFGDFDNGKYIAKLDKDSYIANGQFHEPKVTVSYGDEILEKDKDYTVVYDDNIYAGIGKILIEGINNYYGTIEKKFNILKPSASNCNHIYDENDSCLYCGHVKTVAVLSGTTTYSKKCHDSFSLNIKNSGDGTLSYKSSDTEVAQVDSTGRVTLKKEGSAYIIVSVENTKSFYGTSMQVLIDVDKAEPTISPSATINKTYSTTAFSLKAESTSGGKLTYSSSNKKVATISSAGKIKMKGYGKTTITIKCAKTSTYVSGTKKITLNVVPKKCSISKVKALGSKKIQVSYAINKVVNGYKVQYTMDQNFKNSIKTVTINEPTQNSLTIKKLKKGKTYYIRMRSYIKVGGKTYYSPYSSVKKVKVK